MNTSVINTSVHRFNDIQRKVFGSVLDAIDEYTDNRFIKGKCLPYDFADYLDREFADGGVSNRWDISLDGRVFVTRFEIDAEGDTAEVEVDMKPVNDALAGYVSFVDPVYFDRQPCDVDDAASRYDR